MNNIYDQYVDQYDAGYDDQNRRECVSAKWGRDCPSTVSLPGPLTLTTWSSGLIIVMGSPIIIMIIMIIIIILMFEWMVIIKDITNIATVPKWTAIVIMIKKEAAFVNGSVQEEVVWNIEVSQNPGRYSLVIWGCTPLSLPGHFDSVKFCTKVYSTTKW